jgi:hypothetical protein
MAISFLTGLDVQGSINLNKNELQNAVIQNLATAPGTPSEGQIYYDSSVGDKQLYFYNGSSWIPVSGDIQRIQITADDSNSYNVTSGDFLFTISGDTGISTTLTGSQLEIDLDDTAVTPGSYGSTTAIPVITVDQQGRLTAASTAAIVTTLDIAADSGTDDGVVLGTDTLTISGTTNEIETSVSGDTITVGLVTNPTVSGNLIVSGDLTVSGTTTTVNTETINLADNIITLNSNYTGSTPSENGGIEVERGTADDNVALRWNEGSDTWELTKNGTDYYEIQTVGESTFSATIGDGSATSIDVTHNLGTKDVIVQLYDLSSNDTVYADVVRTSTTVITIGFGSAPATNDIRVLVSKIG